jgi:hypothetical protein
MVRLDEEAVESRMKRGQDCQAMPEGCEILIDGPLKMTRNRKSTSRRAEDEVKHTLGESVIIFRCVCPGGLEDEQDPGR